MRAETSPSGAPSCAADDTDAKGPMTPRRVASRGLFEGRKELVIAHEGQDYRLRITQKRQADPDRMRLATT